MTKKVLQTLIDDYRYVHSHIGRSNRFPGREYIIMVNGEAISPEISDGEYTGEYTTDYPCDVLRLTLEQAERIADEVPEFIVVHWQDACKRVANDLHNAIEFLKGDKK